MSKRQVDLEFRQEVWAADNFALSFSCEAMKSG